MGGGEPPHFLPVFVHEPLLRFEASVEELEAESSRLNFRNQRSTGIVSSVVWLRTQYRASHTTYDTFKMQEDSDDLDSVNEALYALSLGDAGGAGGSGDSVGSGVSFCSSDKDLIAGDFPVEKIMAHLGEGLTKTALRKLWAENGTFECMKCTEVCVTKKELRRHMITENHFYSTKKLAGEKARLAKKVSLRISAIGPNAPKRDLQFTDLSSMYYEVESVEMISFAKIFRLVMQQIMLNYKK
jgi:hypothetical protein